MLWGTNWALYFLNTRRAIVIYSLERCTHAELSCYAKWEAADLKLLNYPSWKAAVVLLNLAKCCATLPLNTSLKYSRNIRVTKIIKKDLICFKKNAIKSQTRPLRCGFQRAQRINSLCHPTFTKLVIVAEKHRQGITMKNVSISWLIWLKLQQYNKMVDIQFWKKSD